MSEKPMTYEEFAEDLANAYPDLDLQELTVDDIKIMMSHALKIEPNKYGLTPASECPPSRRRNVNRNRRTSSTSYHNHATVSSHEQEHNLPEEAFIAASLLEQNANKYHDHDNAERLVLDPSGVGSDMSKLPLATAQALYASAALLSISRGQGPGMESNLQQPIQNNVTVPDSDATDPSSWTYNPVLESRDINHLPTVTSITESLIAACSTATSVTSRPSVGCSSTSSGESNKLRQLLQAGQLALVNRWAEEEAELNANNSAITSAVDKQANQQQVRSRY